MRARTRAAALAALAALAAAPAPAGAEGEPACALADCIRQAIVRHPALAGSEARVAEAKALAGLRKAEALPTIGIDGGTGYINGDAITLYGALGGRRLPDGTQPAPLKGALYDATAVFLLPLYREGRFVGQEPVAEREARLGIQEQEMSRSALRRDVAGSVADAWFTALKLRKAEPLQESVVAARETIAAGARAREEQRLISHATALAASVDLATARHDLETMRIGRARAERALGAATGLVGTAVSPVDDGTVLAAASASTPPADVSASVAAPLSLSSGDTAATSAPSAPDIRAAELRVEQRSEEVLRLRKQGRPSATLRAHYGVADAFDFPINKQWYFGLRIIVPLLDSGQTGQRVAIARAQQEQEEHALASLRLTRTAELDDLQMRVRQIDADLALMTAQIEESREAVRAVHAKAAERLAAPGEEEEAQVALLKLELARSAALHDRALADTRLRIASGQWDSSGPEPGREP